MAPSLSTAFLDYAKASGASGAQPSNYMLQEGAKFKNPPKSKRPSPRAA
jgi:hypothetical protein